MALPSAVASGGGGCVFLPLYCSNSQNNKISSEEGRRSQVENGLSAGALAEPQGDEFSDGLLNGLCCMDRAAADLIFCSLTV